MNTRGKVLKLLKERDGFISGEEIKSLIGVSRTSVNMAVRALKSEGYLIESSTNKGYKLKDSPNIMTKEELSTFLNDDRMRDIDVLESVDSTNAELIRRSVKGTKNGMSVISDMQTAGVGRKGRAFSSPAGSGLYLSYLFKPSEEIKETVRNMGGGMVWARITSWTAVAVSSAIEKLTGIRPGIKWVNDLYIGKRKICGILTQMNTSAELMEVDSIVIGIGINVLEKREDFPEEIRDTAGSILSETGRAVHRAKLAALVIEELDKMTACWPGGQEYYYESYRAGSIISGKEVTVISADKIETLKAIDIDSDFSLIAADACGNIRHILGGDVSIKI